MEAMISNHYYDDDESKKNTFVIRAETMESYADLYRLQVNTETDWYFNEFVNYDYGYNEFNLYRKENEGIVLITNYQTTHETILTPELIEKLGDFVYRSQQKLGREHADSLPCIMNGATVYASGLNFINPDIKSLFIKK